MIMRTCLLWNLRRYALERHFDSLPVFNVSFFSTFIYPQHSTLLHCHAQNSEDEDEDADEDEDPDVGCVMITKRATHKRLPTGGYGLISVCILLTRLCGRMECQDCVRGLRARIV